MIYQIEATVLPSVMFLCDVIGFIQINKLKDIQLLSSLQTTCRGDLGNAIFFTVNLSHQCSLMGMFIFEVSSSLTK